MLYPTQYPYNPGTLPSSASQCILENVYLRSSSSRNPMSLVNVTSLLRQQALQPTLELEGAHCSTNRCSVPKSLYENLMAPVLGSRTTAVQALRGADLTGKTAVVTGGNSGIGVETARALAHAGARVILTSRKVSAGEEVAATLQSAGVKGFVEVQQLDLADLSNVRSFANNLQSEPKIDMLILNAGVAGLPLTYTKDNFEMQVGTNHFGHFVLVQSLLDKLKKQGSPVRIVAVSSTVHRHGGFDIDDLNFRHRTYSGMAAYAQSKLCNILFTKELANRLQGSNIEVFCLHPGIIASGLSRHMGLLKYAINYGLYFFSKSAEQGAATSVYAATAPELSGKSGAYLADCNIAEPTAQAQDAELAKRLWAVTEKQLQDPAART